MNGAQEPPLRRLRFDAGPCKFPHAAVPMLAHAELSALRWTADPRLTAPPQVTQSFKRGRYALHEALRRSNIGPGTALLAPSYHCLTMLDPALRLGASVKLYPVNTDLSPNMDALRTILNGQTGDTRIRALLIPHYFGIAQAFKDMTELRQLCLDTRTCLIEDCAHILALGPQYPVPGIGIHGDWIVSSPYKFFPIPHGGLLWSATHDDSFTKPHNSTQPPLWREFLSLAKELLRRRTSYFPVGGNASSTSEIDAAREWQEACDAASPYYHSGDEPPQESAVSKWVIRHTDIQALGDRRREVFNKWLELCQTLGNASPLHTKLPDGAIPYMFPLLLKDSRKHFNALKRTGLPIGRWDNMVDSTCPTAMHYRTSLIHLPCHQSIDNSQWAWMAATLQQVLAQ